MKKKVFTLLTVCGAIVFSANAQIKLGDFEDGGIVPTYYNESGEDVACIEVSVRSNPDRTGINKSAKTLYAETNWEQQDAWWGGPRVDFKNSFKGNAENAYLHIMMKTDLPKFELLVITADGESWNGTFFNPTETGWFDYVVDLTDVKGDDLTLTKIGNITGFRIAVSVNDEGQQEKKLYLDEIIVSNSPTPRDGNTSSIQGFLNEAGNIVAVDNGIIIKDIAGKVNICNLTGAKVYEGISTGDLEVNLEKGFYIVSVGNTNKKVLVK